MHSFSQITNIRDTHKTSISSNNSQQKQISELHFDSLFEKDQEDIKNYISDFEAFKDTFKKYVSSLNNFANGLQEVSKKESLNNSQPLGQITIMLQTFLGVFHSHLKQVHQQSLQTYDAIKLKLEQLKDFKNQIKKNFEEQRKIYLKTKKEFTESNQKMQEIQLKINEFSKFNDKISPQYQILKQEFQFAKNETDTRYQSKKECNIYFQNFQGQESQKKLEFLSSISKSVQDTIISNHSLFTQMILNIQQKYFTLLLSTFEMNNNDNSKIRKSHSSNSISKVYQSTERQNNHGTSPFETSLSQISNKRSAHSKSGNNSQEKLYFQSGEKNSNQGSSKKIQSFISLKNQYDQENNYKSKHGKFY